MIRLAFLFPAAMLAMSCARHEPSSASVSDNAAVMVVAAPVASTANNDFALQAWMKTNAASALKSGDFSRLEQSFTRIAELAPVAEGFSQWRDISDRGVTAAQRHDLDGARIACLRCHEAYRTSYRARFRTPASPPLAK